MSNSYIDESIIVALRALQIKCADDPMSLYHLEMIEHRLEYLASECLYYAEGR